jgi:hypothetical protein
MVPQFRGYEMRVAVLAVISLCCSVGALAADKACQAKVVAFNLCDMAKAFQDTFRPALPSDEGTGTLVIGVTAIGPEIVFEVAVNKKTEPLRVKAERMSCGRKIEVFIRFGGKMTYHFTYPESGTVTTITVDRCPSS